MYSMFVECFLTPNFTNICTSVVSSTMDLPTPFEYEPKVRALAASTFCCVFVVFLFFLPFFPFNLHSSSKYILEVFRAKCTWENVWRHTFYLPVDNNACRNAEMTPWANIELNPTKTKHESEETRSDSFNNGQCRSYRWWTRTSHKNRYDCLMILRHFENREGLEGSLRTHDTVPRSTSGYPKWKA